MATDAEIRKILKELERRRKYRVMDFFEPYAKQSDFFALGATRRERLFMAGNQLGKCISARTPVLLASGNEVPAGTLFEWHEQFAVWSFDRQRKMFCPATVTHVVKKEPEPLVRIWTRSGRWFECALDHRVMVSGNWRFVRDILPDSLLRQVSSLESGPRVRVPDVWRSLQKAQDYQDRCSEDSRPCDERPRPASTGAQDAETLQAGAPPHIQFSSRWDGPWPTHTNTDQLDSVRPSSPGEVIRYVGRFAESPDQDACTSAQRTTSTHPDVRQLPTGSFSLSQSFASIELDQLRDAYQSLNADNQFIACKLLESEPVYDFTVADFHNYVAAGVVHHNTEAGAFECACHMTGMYPANWQGRKWDRPVKFWFAGETSLLARDVLQKKLCGEPGVEAAYGTGMIPKECFADKPSLARGITDAYDTIQVKHVSGGISVGRFKSYEQGQTKFQGETLDGVWLDEEPDIRIYSEALTRVTATKGMVFLTFTPLKGMSDVVARFLNEPSEDRAVVTMTIDDALHIPAEEREKIVAGYPAHEREARARGVPMLGSGRVFPVAEEMIAEEFKDPPAHWPKLWGIDFGTGHPFGAVLYAWDKDADCLHILHAFRVKDARPMDHAKAMKPWGADIPVAWPRDGTNREANLKPLAALYREEGLNMLPEHATFPDGGVSTEAGIQEMHERMTTSRFKVAKHLTEWWEEFRMYHRKDGLIVKLRDDLMSASRIGMMMRRYARLSGGVRPKPIRAVSSYRPGEGRREVYRRRSAA